MFNAFNHTQFSGINSGMTFNAAGQIVNLPSSITKGAQPNGGTEGFGAVTGARDPASFNSPRRLTSSSVFRPRLKGPAGPSAPQAGPPGV